MDSLGSGTTAHHVAMDWSVARSPRPPVRIVQRRIVRLHTHLVGVRRDAVLTPALERPADHRDALCRAGLPADAEPGCFVLPAVVGLRSRFNADGAGPGRPGGPGAGGAERGAGTGAGRWRADPWSDRRRPRRPVAAPEVRLRAALTAAGAPVVAGEPLARGRDDGRLLRSVNLLLELFGECTLLGEPLRPVPRSSRRRLDWEVARSAAGLHAALGGAAGPARHLRERRLSVLAGLRPDLVAVGRAGFRDIVVVGSPEARGLVVEVLGGAADGTYVTRLAWPELAAMGRGALLAALAAEMRLDLLGGSGTRLRAEVAAV